MMYLPRMTFIKKNSLSLWTTTLFIGIGIGIAKLDIFWPRLCWAADPEKPRGMPLWIFRVHPEMAVTTKWEDNIYKTATNTKSDEIILIEPTISLVKKFKKRELSLAVGMESETYRNQHSEDNIGYKFKLDYGFEPYKRLKIDLGYEFLIEHEERGVPGVGATATFLGPNQWQQQALKLSSGFTLNRLQTDLNLEHANRESGNNDQFTQNRIWDDVGLIFKWAFFPKTGLLLETGWKGIEYDNQPSQDSQEWRVLVGTTWHLTAKTSGNFKIGTTAKTYDLGLTPESSEISWSSEIDWLPWERTHLTWNTGRRFQESESGSYVMTDYKIHVNHQLLSRLSLLSDFSLSNSDYGVSKNEDYLKAQLGLKYQFPRWLTLNTDYIWSAKQSDQIDSDYESNGLSMTLTGAL